MKGSDWPRVKTLSQNFYAGCQTCPKLNVYILFIFQVRKRRWTLHCKLLTHGRRMFVSRKESCPMKVFWKPTETRLPFHKKLDNIAVDMNTIWITSKNYEHPGLRILNPGRDYSVRASRKLRRGPFSYIFFFNLFSLGHALTSSTNLS